jgi:cobalt-zinc-cadmium resistance protein CzcA
MLNRAIDFCLDNRWVVFLLLAIFVMGGLMIVRQIPIDAFPDLTNNQVVITTEAPGMPPTEVEQLVTFPIETSVMGLPKVETVRSISKLGLSMVTVVFDDSVNNYFARRLIRRRCSATTCRCERSSIGFARTTATLAAGLWSMRVSSTRSSGWGEQGALGISSAPW